MRSACSSACGVLSELRYSPPAIGVTDNYSHNRRRQVKDVDFGLTFPAVPDISQPSQQTVLSQSTPQVDLPLVAQAPASSRRGRPLGAISPENNLPITRSIANDANISAKRRKLNSDQAPPSSSARTTRATLPAVHETGQPARTVGHVLAEEEVERDELEIPAQILSPRTAQDSSLPEPVAELVTESPANAPGSGHRMRVSLNEANAQSLRLQDGLQDSSPVGAAHITSSPAQKRKRRIGDATPKNTMRPSRPLKRNKDTQEDEGDLDELSPDQTRGRIRNPKQLATKRSVAMEVDEEDVSQHSAEEAEEIDDAEAAAILKESRGRGRPSIPAAGSPDLDEPTPVTTKKKRGRPSKISTPAQQRQPKPAAPQAKAKPASKPSKTSTKSANVRGGSPIPITVHRFTKRLLYDDDESDADILNSEIPYITRSGVNPIDVLNQVCHEIIDSGLDTLAEGGRKATESALRREYKTKWSAVEAFGRELQNRLLEHVSILEMSANSYCC